MSSFSPLNRQVPKIGFAPFCHHVQIITSEWQNFKLGGFSIGYVHVTSELTDSRVSPFCLLLCPVRHLWTVNTLSLIISNQLCPVRHLWTDEYPISHFFVIMSSSSPLNDKASCLVIPNQLCPARHLWTDGYPDLTFPVSYTHLTLPTKRIV